VNLSVTRRAAPEKIIVRRERLEPDAMRVENVPTGAVVNLLASSRASQRRVRLASPACTVEDATTGLRVALVPFASRLRDGLHLRAASLHRLLPLELASLHRARFISVRDAASSD
jgi:hypothetical protein